MNNSDNPMPQQPVESEYATPPGSAFNQKEPQPTGSKRQGRTGLFIVIVGLVALIVGTVATIALYKAFFENKSAPASQTSDVQGTSAPLDTQNKQIVIAIEHINSLLPTVNTSATIEVPHRKLNSPYNFYSAGTKSSAWSISSKVITDVASATALTKTIHDYFTKDLSASVDVLIGDNTVSKLSETGRANVYRFTTAGYTCGLYELAEPSSATAQSITGVSVSVGCSPLAEYTRNADIQQDFYTALLASDKDYTTENTMLNLPVIQDSATPGYKLAEAEMVNDSSLTEMSTGLFYQTTDATWRFFTAAKGTLACTAYNSTDLKKAYSGMACIGADGKESKVAL